MCGIAGAINLGRLNENNIFNSLKHRGPDDFGVFRDSSVGGLLQFFHTRLSIQDLSLSAKQPMICGDYAIIFNGEIYNHLDFRQNLNFNFKTHSDTETLLALFITHKQKFLENLDALDGMFAFAIYDKLNQKVYFARDRMGKKPLFYYLQNRQFAFCSELNALYKMLDSSLELDKEKIAFYLQSGFFYKDSAPFKSVFSLPQASFATLSLADFSLQITPYFSLESCYKKAKIKDEKEALNLCESHLKTSIKRRIESSDLEVGAFLSGGIDSSLIVAFASCMVKKLRTFTISFDSSEFDEAPLASKTAQLYNTEHRILKIKPNLKDDIFKILANYGRPFFDSSAIPSFYVAKAAKEHLSVVLNGDGADELFGGYRRYVGHLLIPKILPFLPLFKPLLPFLPTANKKTSIYQYAMRLLEMALSYKSDKALYYLKATNNLAGILNVKSADFTAFSDEANRIFNSDLCELDKMLLMDSRNLLFADLLPKMDIATMANSLEARSPFLSKEMVEFAATLLPHLKIRGKTTKYILRKLAKKYLPESVCNAPKMGFEIPLSLWVDSTLKDCIKDVLKSPKISLEFLDKNTLESLLQNSQNYPKQQRAKTLWSIFALEVWYQGL
ncbi:MAG: asparagine synthase (glutamine-hydrolyzing) [Helicobacter sp.]|nr:asparagine synthase (glutamine-hydrolyzing) [Helicobacteraceae bacterium]MDY3113320.1 asparagine synthase (glutamine-hydrolyzing) [Helicobacter sp.]